MMRAGKKQRDKKITLAPLDFEEALSDLLKTGPHPKDKPDNEKAPPKGHRSPRTRNPKPGAGSRRSSTFDS